MDIDNETGTNTTSADNIEQSLLQQFSCMGTTDKEELVQQLQKLLGSPTHLNFATASFYLDMNNWNLQAAICSYLDIESLYNLPSMSLLSNPVATETESIEPNVTFEKIWHISNSGTDTWPVGCYAQCADGHNLGVTTTKKIPLPCLQPGHSTDLHVEMMSPQVPGVYQSKWRCCTPNGAYFGDAMWAIITVVEQGTIELTEQLSHFNELGAHAQNNVNMSAHNPFLTTARSQHVTKDEAPPDDHQMC